MSLFQHPPKDRRFAQFARRFDIAEGDFFRPLAILGALALLVLTLGVHYSVRAIDQSSEKREQILVQNGITQRIAEVAQMVVPQVDWDDAVSKLDNGYDATWAEANIGKFLSQTDGFDMSFVIGADGRPLFAAIGSATAPVARYAAIAPLAAPLIAQVRDGERQRGAIRPTPSGAMVSKPIQASALKMIDGQLTILTATLVQPDFGKALPRGPVSPMVITAMTVDHDFLDQFATRYLLSGLRLRPADSLSAGGETRIAARDDRDQVIAWLAWHPFAPGYAMLHTMIGPVLVIGLGLALIGFIQLRNVHHAAAYLIWREKQVRALAHFDPVTSLPNEHFLREDIGHRLAGQDEVFAVLLAYPWRGTLGCGTEDGDALHQAMARRLQLVCPAEGILARLSDGGFAFLVPTRTADGAEALRASLEAALSNEHRIAVGLALVEDAERGATEILEAVRTDLRARVAALRA